MDNNIETLQLIKGNNIEKFKLLGNNYVGSLFFDVSTNKIYLGALNENSEFIAKPMDSNLIKTTLENGESGVYSTLFSFVGHDGNVISINDTNIPTLDNEDAFGRLDINNSESGFMSVKDKYILDKIADALGVEVTINNGIARFKMNDINKGGGTSGSDSGNTGTSDNISLYFDGGDTDDNTELLVDHGSIKAGTTIADLEKLTLSEVFKQILLETAEPVKIKNLQFAINILSPYNSIIDVGRTLPFNINYFSYSFIPETWNWTASDGKTTGKAVELNIFDSIEYYYNDTNNINITSSTINMKDTIEKWKYTIEGENGYFFAKCTYNEGNDAKNSLGLIKSSYGKKYSGILYSNILSYIGAWKIYANACLYYTNVTNAFNSKDIEGTYRGINTQTGYTYITNATTIILQWPKKADLLADEKLFIYVPYNTIKYKVVSAVNVSDTIASFSGATLTTTYIEDVIINNSYSDGIFSKYEISPNAGVTTCQITIAKGEHN